MWDEIEQIKNIDSLEALTERLRSVNTSSDSLTLKWEEMMSLIRAHGAMDYVSIDLSIVRGLAYYTGFVYEAYEASGEGGALAGVEDMIIWFKSLQIMLICQLADSLLEI